VTLLWREGSVGFVLPCETPMNPVMPRSFSTYLDLVRFLAACMVYLWHSNQRWIVEAILPASSYGHSSVVVFFVLSGFVIAFVTDTKERDWQTYAASRLSRVYSVALPALILTILLDAAGRQLYLPAYDYPFDSFAVRNAASLLMANEIWFVSITAFSNVPYWSICYESWYYVGFGVVTFLPRAGAWLVVSALALLLGPKIVLLAPIWAMGVLLYRSRRLAEVSEPMGWFLMVGSTLGIVLFHVLGVDLTVGNWLKAQIGVAWFDELTFSKTFISDYLLGLLVMLHFAGARSVAPRLSGILQAIERPVKTMAACTFTLYLLHQPLFLFWGAVLRGDPKGYGNWLAITCLVGLSVALVAVLTEKRRHLLTRWIRQQLTLFNSARRIEPS